MTTKEKILSLIPLVGISYCVKHIFKEQMEFGFWFLFTAFYHAVILVELLILI
jgi:hypothetical protein